MSVPDMPDLCSLFRPFGAAIPFLVDVPCRVVPRLWSGRGAYTASNYLTWTHFADLGAAVDVRDACSRSAGTTLISYADGDGLKMVVGARSISWVVVWVEDRYTNTGQQWRRAYLARDFISY